MTPLYGPIGEAVEAALRGELIVFPTDTVYGIGTRPDDPAATARVFEAKRRSRDLELPILVANAEAARAVAVLDERTERLIQAFWPGPLTIVLARRTDASGWELGGDSATVGVRAPRHPMAFAILAETGPLAVTSANRSGQPPASTCEELHALFGDDVAVYLCEEEPLRGAASTVVDLAHDAARVLRAGDVTASELAVVLPDEPSLLDSPPST